MSSTSVSKLPQKDLPPGGHVPACALCDRDHDGPHQWLCYGRNAAEGSHQGPGQAYQSPPKGGI